MNKEEGNDAIRKILSSQNFSACTKSQQQKTSDEFLVTEEIKQEIKEKDLESLDYNTFLTLVRKGSIEGKDLLALCGTSSKLQSYSHKAFELRDEKGLLIQEIPNYLFVLLLAGKDIQLLPGQNARKIYKQQFIGGYVSNSENLNNKEKISPFAVLKNITQISVGNGHSLALDNQMRVWGFGSNFSGELGPGMRNEKINSPIQIMNLVNIVKISAGNTYSLCLDNQGHVWSFGFNEDGQLGLRDFYYEPIPKMIPDFDKIIQISAGDDHSLVLDNQGRVWSFGNNNQGQLGLGDTNKRNIPSLIPELEKIVQISANTDYSLCLDDQGHVWIFGRSLQNSGFYKPFPFKFDSLDNIIQISTGFDHFLCLDNRGHVWSFGINTFGQLGLGDTAMKRIPIQIPYLNNIIQISAGNSYSLCLDIDGCVWSFGINRVGQLGLSNNYTNVTTPTKISNLNHCIKISTGYKYTLFIIKP